MKKHGGQKSNIYVKELKNAKKIQQNSLGVLGGTYDTVNYTDTNIRCYGNKPVEKQHGKQ